MIPRLLLALLTAAAAFAQNDAAARIDEILQPWNKPDAPGASVAVVRDGKVIFQKGYGAATLEFTAPITPETIFHVASVSKQFTAMSLVLLEQDGKLSLDDDLHKYLPELPDYGRPITIRNLLQHTSGIRDQWQTLALAGWRLDDVITHKQILRMLFRQKELNFAPGTKHLYSNGGYSLAAEIVTRVSGKPYPDFAEERIFRPLAMTRTHVHDDHTHVVPGRAYSYELRRDTYFNSPLNYANMGATSLFTTAPDLAKWLDNFRDPKVGGAAGVARLQEQAVLVGGEKIDYALGVSVGKYRGLRSISHGGADAGYRSFVVWFPDQRLGIAVLSNLASFNTAGIANRIAAVYLEKEMAPEADPAAAAPERKFVTLDPASLDAFEGFYKTSDLLLRVSKRDGKLFGSPVGAPPQEFKPLAPGKFYVERMRADLEFVARDSGAMHLKMTQPGGSTEFERVSLKEFDPAAMSQYTGVYWSEELETQYTIRIKDGKLIADHAHHGEIALTPIANDMLRGSNWFMQDVNFVRDPAGKIDGMILGGGRVTGIRFTKR